MALPFTLLFCYSAYAKITPNVRQRLSVLKVFDADLDVPEHARAVVQLLDEYACDLMGGGERLSEYCVTNLPRELQRRSNIHVALAFVDGAPAGLCISIEGFSTFACKPLLNIHDVAVSPAFRGRGISKALMAHVEETARRLGCCKITLEVLSENHVAMNLYKSVGFSQYQLDPKSGGALFLQKKLA
jgi:ribosomal protein S18 acetylase RimI-like enzyme